MPTDPAACPGNTSAAALIDLSPSASVTMSPSWMPRPSASVLLMRAALSHVSLLTGSGSSCIQALLAALPSYTTLDGRKTSSSPCGALKLASFAIVDMSAAGTDAAASSLPGSTPSWSVLSQRLSKSSPSTGFQVSRTRS